MLQKVIPVLKAITGITDHVILTYPYTIFTNEYETMLGCINLEKLGENKDDYNDVGIYNLRQFLSIVSLHDNPNISIQNNTFVIEDSKSKSTFPVSNPLAMKQISYPLDIVQRIKEYPAVFRLSLDKEIMNTIKKSGSAFSSLNALKLGDTLQLIQNDSFTNNSESFSLKVSPVINNLQTDIVVSLSEFMSIPSLNYELSVHYNESKDSYRVLVCNEFMCFVMGTL